MQQATGCRRQNVRAHVLWAFGAGVLTLAGCARAGRPDLAHLYTEAAQYHDVARNPIIVVPGILGSKLTDTATERVVWGAFAGDYANPATPEGARLVALPMVEGAPLYLLRDGAAPAGVLDRVRVSLLGLPLQLNAYRHILTTLGVGGYRDQLLGEAGAIDYGPGHYTCFQFDYDWRRDVAESAAQLHEFILEKRAYVQQEVERRHGIANAEVKFDIVAHSMGGLVTRYYLRYGNQPIPEEGHPRITWEGAALVDRAILVGSPNAGAAQALVQLVEGTVFGPTLPRYEPAVLGTMPALYQLLPRSRHEQVRRDGRPIPDLLDPALWETEGWGLAARNQARVLQTLLPDIVDADERRRIALDHQRKCLLRARQFQAALDAPAARPERLGLYLLAGDAVPTDAIVDVRPAGRVAVVGRQPGDGTVLRTSALLDERIGTAWTPRVQSPIDWTNVTFLFTDHLGLTTDPAFADNVLYLLLEAPR